MLFLSCSDLLTQPHTIIGLGDGGAHYSMICDAALPTYFLTYWVRDAAPDRREDVDRQGVERTGDEVGDEEIVEDDGEGENGVVDEIQQNEAVTCPEEVVSG